MFVERVLFLTSCDLFGFGFVRMGSVADPLYVVGGGISSVLKICCVDMAKSVNGSLPYQKVWQW